MTFQMRALQTWSTRGKDPVVHCVLWSLLLCLPLAHAADRVGPTENLLIQWRVVHSEQLKRQESGVKTGGVVIDSRSGVSGRAVVTWGHDEARSEQQHDGQVLVLNGAVARVLLQRQQPVWQWQWSCLPPACRGAPGTATPVTLTTAWVDRGQGVRVQPRWPGGQRPVTLAFEVETDGDWQADTGGQATQTTVQSTVEMPLDRWFTVAQSAGQQMHQQHQRQLPGGVYSTESVRQPEYVLQWRVLRP